VKTDAIALPSLSVKDVSITKALEEASVSLVGVKVPVQVILLLVESVESEPFGIETSALAKPVTASENTIETEDVSPIFIAVSPNDTEETVGLIVVTE
jgi:hypothetical protein